MSIKYKEGQIAYLISKFIIYIMKQIAFLSFFTMLLSIGCNRDDIDNKIIIDTYPPDTTYFFDSNMIGHAYDENNESIEYTEVSDGYHTTYTNDKGVFRNIYLKSNKNGVILRWMKNGYYPHYSFFIPEEKSTHAISAKLIKLNSPLILDNTKDLRIPLTTSVSMIVPENAFIDNSQQPYTGKVNIYIQKIDDSMLNVTAENARQQKMVMSDGQAWQLIYKGDNGRALSIIKPIMIQFPKHQSCALLDQLNTRWKYVKPISNETSNHIENISSSPFIIGELQIKTLVRTQVLNEEFLPVYGVNIEIIDNQGHHYSTTSNQNGKLQVFLPINKTYSVIAKDLCNNILSNSEINVSDKNLQVVSNIIIPSSLTRAIQSQVDYCSSQWSFNDKLYTVIENETNHIPILIDNSIQKYALPKCIQSFTAKYYRNEEFLYQISYTGQSTSSTIILKNPTDCLQSISGILKVNGQEVLYNSNQFSIIKENGDSGDIAITDYAGFIISIPEVINPGIYQSKAIIINNPISKACLEDDCSNIKAQVLKIGALGKEVSIIISGHLDGYKLEGSFTNILKK